MCIRSADGINRCCRCIFNFFMSVVVVAVIIAEIEDDDFFLLIFLVRMGRLNSSFILLHVRGRVYTKSVYSLFVNAVNFFSEDKFGPEFDLK